MEVVAVMLVRPLMLFRRMFARSNILSKTDAQFKADAEARHRAFAAAKQEHKEGGEARRRRFADFKEQANAPAGLKNEMMHSKKRLNKSLRMLLPNCNENIMMPYWKRSM